MHIVSLHDHGQLMWREDAIESLTREVDKILAKTAADEVINDMLDWMLEGWVFGERDSSLPIAGYVPALEKTRQLRPVEARSDAAHSLAAKTLAAIEAQRGKETELRAAGALLSNDQKVDNINQSVVVRQAVRKVRKVLSSSSSSSSSSLLLLLLLLLLLFL